MSSTAIFRINRTLEFPDFTTKELVEVFRTMAKKAKYKLSSDVERWLEPDISLKDPNASDED